MTNVQMDLGPLACPGPLVAISKAIRVMNPGETLEVNATDPAFCADVRAWCEMTGNQLLALEQGDAGCRAATLQLMDAVERGVGYLIDVNRSEKSSPAARKIWKEPSAHEKAGKVAFFGLHPLAGVPASLVMGIAHKRDMGFFKTKEAALAWLKD